MYGINEMYLKIIILFIVNTVVTIAALHYFLSFVTNLKLNKKTNKTHPNNEHQKDQRK